MKSLKLLIISLFLMLAFGSCKDNSENAVNPNETGANYLVMFYSLGGKTLDSCLISNIAQAIDEGGNEKVKMTFEYKLSKAMQKSDTCRNFNGTRRFTLDDNAHLKGKFQSVSKKYPLLDKDGFAFYMDELKSEKIGEADYNMDSSDNLADFIKWSKSKYPDAKRTILVLSSHGSGWNIHRDGKSSTRAILFDDNLKDTCLMAQDVVNGINNGGGIDLLYEDACLMSMYENLYTYAKGVRYLMAAVETIADEGGDYRKFLNLLKSAGTSDAELEETMHKYTDYCTSDQWWSRKDGEQKYSDIGLYDLSKLGAATPVLKEVANTLAEKFASNESVQPTELEPFLGDSYVPYLRKAFTNALTSYRADDMALSVVPKNLVPYVQKDITPKKDPETGDDIVDGRKLIDWVRFANTANAQEAYNTYREDWDKLRQNIVKATYITFSLTDLLRNLNNDLVAVGAQNNPFGQLHKELVSAIKNMAYISCSMPDNLPGIDQPYELCSPGIVIVPLNELYDKDPQFSAIKSYQTALSYYQSSDFDKQVGWSKILKLIDVRPTLLTNPGRNDKK